MRIILIYIRLIVKCINAHKFHVYNSIKINMLGVTHPQHGDTPTATRRWTGLMVTIALHSIAIVLLLSYEPIRSVLTEAAPIMVSLINPVVEKPKERPKPPPVRTKVERPLPPQPLPLLTAVTEAPTAPEAQPPPPLPPPPAPVEVAAPKPVLAQAPAPVLPVIPPNFNADYLDNPPPAYPAASRRLREEGRVILRVFVNIHGTPDKVELRTGSGSQRLDEAALDTVKRWRFVPARQGSQPVAAWVLIPISFALKG